MLKDKSILLTGATGGIGSEIARSLAAREANLILVDVDKQALEQLADELKGNGHRPEVVAVDLTLAEDRQQIRQLIESRFGVLDILINCAGINVFSMFEELDESQIVKMVAVNITAPILLTKLLLPFLKSAQAGQIVNFGSTFGSIGYPGFVTYSATKFALRGFTEALRRELGNSSVSISYIAPRATRTSLNTGPVNAMNEALGVKMDTPDVVAAQVVDILERGRSSTRYLGWPEKLFVRVNGLLPRLVDNALVKQLETIKRFASSHS